MTEKTYWLICDGNYALATGELERDRWIPLGWAVADAGPAGQDRVWAWHDGVELPAQFGVGAFASLWEPRGWKPGPPPGGDHPFGFASQAATATTPPASAGEEKSTKSAAGGSAKEKVTDA